jgi:phosphatidate cytidylyltransferase
MKKRIITGIFITIVFILVAFFSLWKENAFVFDIFVLFLMFLSSLEMAKAIKRNTIRPCVPAIFISIAVSFSVFTLVRVYYGVVFSIFAFFLVELATVVLVWLISQLSKKETKYSANATAFVLCYPVAFLAFMLMLGNFPSLTHRAAGVLFLFLVAPFTDVFAYAVGSTIKGPKLCPSISPKKTISGAIGGLLGGMLGGLLVYLFVVTGIFEFIGLGHISNSLEVMHFIFIGILASVFTQLGDLVASYVKRKVGIKDYSNLLPGHGGIMDRIDGMMMSAMVIFLYLSFLA